MKDYSSMDFDEIEDEIWKEFLDSASPLEIHKAVIDSNWDGNGFLLRWIVDNPNVDRATILIAYWMSAPKWFKQYATKEECNDQGQFDILEEIELKYSQDFYVNTAIEMDPFCDQDGYDWANEYPDLVLKRDIPPVMYVKLEGVKVERPTEGYEEGLPEEYSRKLHEILDQYDQ